MMQCWIKYFNCHGYWRTQRYISKCCTVTVSNYIIIFICNYSARPSITKELITPLLCVLFSAEVVTGTRTPWLAVFTGLLVFPAALLLLPGPQALSALVTELPVLLWHCFCFAVTRFASVIMTGSIYTACSSCCMVRLNLLDNHMAAVVTGSPLSQCEIMMARDMHQSLVCLNHVSVSITSLPSLFCRNHQFASVTCLLVTSLPQPLGLRYLLVFLGLFFTLLICSLYKHWKDLVIPSSWSWITSTDASGQASLFSKHAAHSQSSYLLANTPPPPASPTPDT